METLSTNRGGTKLCFAGYMYTKKAVKPNRIRWECSLRRTKDCKGAITTDLGNGDIHVTQAHSHDPQPHDIGVEKFKATIRERSTTTRETTGQILTTAVSATSNPVKERLGRMDSHKRSIRRRRQGNRPREPTTIRDVDIPGEWQTTGGDNPEPFLFHDSGRDFDHHRVILFGTDTGLRHLATAQKWYMDGNFSMAPSQFLQLYVIRARVGDSAVSGVYGLLSHKTQDCYRELLQAVMDHCETLGFTPDPTTVITDFEMPVMNAVQDVIGRHVTTQGCFFHLTQSTWRKLQSLGLAERYRTDDEARLFSGMVDALAFLPLGDIPEGMAYLRANIPNGFQELLDYFDTTYVSGTFRRIQAPPNNAVVVPPVRMRRIPPLFPPAVWTVFDITLAGEDRTNNLCEAWNLGFSRLVTHSHPALWTLIDCLRKDAHMSTALILQHAAGQTIQKRVKRATRDLQERLNRICVARRDGQRTIAQTLRAAGHTIRLA